MNARRFLGSLLIPVALGVTSIGVAPSADAGDAQPMLTAVTASHGSTFDRVTFQFDSGLPTAVAIQYVDELIADGSGAVIPVPGRRILGVRMEGVVAHHETGHASVPRRETFALPNVMIAINNGDFEAVVNYGIGLAKGTTFVWRTVPDHDRVVLEVRSAFTTTPRRVFLFDSERFAAGTPPYVKGVIRPVIPNTPATALMDRMFAGPTEFEKSNGLRFVRSDATTYSNLSISRGIARIRLRGGCRSHGSTFTIANEIMPTLRQLDSVDWVKIYGPRGITQEPTGNSDSIPECLEP